ncbi:hypothetical protein NPX13_g11428 [Xylaria arbuscula]|uniref:Uncharacterized protein n=1 Tax=Xylaria arbuscula TaxID=114810 RepID=A0A9W8N2R1_9PEZI|nr:hypothetical protein NPX13_g11428 [Xylaria arbuscula]
MLQRMYGRIWNMSPTMEKKLGKKAGTHKWSVTWGTTGQKISAPLSKGHSFFQGVANDGTLLAKAETPSKR